MLEYYNAVELEPFIEAVTEAHAEVDKALEKRAHAIEALTEAYQAIEDKRAALAEDRAAEEDEDA
jgi:hypothetical protein